MKIKIKSSTDSTWILGGVEIGPSAVECEETPEILRYISDGLIVRVVEKGATVEETAFAPKPKLRKRG